MRRSIHAFLGLCAVTLGGASNVACSSNSEVQSSGDSGLHGDAASGGAGSGTDGGTGTGAHTGSSGGNSAGGGTNGSGGTPGHAGSGGASTGGAPGGAGGASAHDGGGVDGGGCGKAGAACCDPFPGDGPNYCTGGLKCGDDDACVDCGCVRGAYFPVCGTDGKTYDATCGAVCVPVAIACNGECPCQCTANLAKGCSGATPGTEKACCSGLQCCEGVPYDAAGECHAECNLKSDRNAKTDIRPADTQALLESVATLPISTWSYRSEPDVHHVGPMAQDFSAGFRLGGSDRVIAAVDANGVALASIQALYERVEKLARDNARLEGRVRELEGERASRATAARR